MWNNLSEKMETTSVKNLPNLDAAYFSTHSKNLIANEENWHFQTHVRLESL